MLGKRSINEALEEANKKFEVFQEKIFRRNIRSPKPMEKALRESVEVRDKLSFELLHEDTYNVSTKNITKFTTK